MCKYRLVYNSAIFILIWNGLPALATVYESDGSPTNIQYIHDALTQNGDTITLPPGTFTWSTAVVFTKTISVQGAGTNQTTIYDNVPKAGGGQRTILWTFKANAGFPFRVTGFTVHGQAQDTQNYNAGTLVFSGTNHAIRIDHVNVVLPGTGALMFNGDLWGVIDHCSFDESNFKQAIQIHHGNWNGELTDGWGDSSFEDGLHLGTERAIYIEDCTFVGSGIGGAGVVDSTFGGRFVFRRNTVTADFLGMHGTEGFRGRGCRSYEIYNNTFTDTTTIMPHAILLRSGTGVVFNNTFSGGGVNFVGYHNGIELTIYRSTVDGVHECASGNHFGAPWGMATGSNPWDGNQGVLGYPALDQTARGTCLDQVRGDNPINQRTGTAAWPRNQSEPIYEWNNTIQPIPNNPGALFDVQCTADLLQQGRDYYNNTPMPGYTPYTYPHPLVTGGDSTPTPSPTPTATATATATPSPTPTPTATATATATPAPTPQPSSTPTPTATATPITSVTPTATATPRHSPRPHPSHAPG
jgi:hypothetical protein